MIQTSLTLATRGDTVWKDCPSANAYAKFPPNCSDWKMAESSGDRSNDDEDGMITIGPTPALAIDTKAEITNNTFI